MSLLPAVIHTALATAYTPALRRLERTRDLRGNQARLLSSMLAANQDSEFGRAHDFARLTSVDDFRAAVPLTTWDDYQQAADRIAEGASGVLTTEKVRLLEPSSGSTAATKLIPYTATLANQFRAGLRPWLADLYTSHPALRAGPSYWSVTPAASHPQRPSVVPIGFDEDADYLGPVAGRLLSQVFAVDASVARAETMDEFRLRTCQGLLGAEDLRLVSVWNPTFFTLLLDWAADHSDAVLAGLPARRRVAVEGLLRDRDWPAIWPKLHLISCWADAQAVRPASELQRRFPDATLQPKGLLATEAIVSIPLERAGGAVLAADSHFFEFLTLDVESQLADELAVGASYQVVVTTGGGLYRYRLGDLVEVTGHHGVLPVLRFIGRADKVTDLVGEKLNEAFVINCLRDLQVPGFNLLVGTSDPVPHYVLFTHSTSPGLAERLDAALRASFHYDYARRLVQLGPLEVRPARPDAEARLLAAQTADGQRLGDIKPAVLVVGDRLSGVVGQEFTPNS